MVVNSYYIFQCIHSVQVGCWKGCKQVMVSLQEVLVPIYVNSRTPRIIKRTFETKKKLRVRELPFWWVKIFNQRAVYDKFIDENIEHFMLLRIAVLCQIIVYFPGILRRHHLPRLVGLSEDIIPRHKVHVTRL